jgi:hypothetical protein
MCCGKHWVRNLMALSGLGLLLLQLPATAQGGNPVRAGIKTALNYYENLEYEAALEEIRRAQGQASTKIETVTTMLYEGIILSEMGRDEDAAAVFRSALHLHPTVSLPMKVAPKVARHFEVLRRVVQEESKQSAVKSPSSVDSSSAHSDGPSASPKEIPQPSTDETLVVPKAPEKSLLLLSLSSDVKGAHLFIDAQETGQLPLSAPLSLDPGEHTVVIRRPGFAEFSRRFTIESGKSHKVTVALEAIAGVVAVTADVPGASVTIDGQFHGKVPLTGILLKPGSHEVIITLEGHEPDSKTLEVQAGQDYTISGTLKPAGEVTPAVDRPEKPILTPIEELVSHAPVIPATSDRHQAIEIRPWFKRWYIWAGVGAVVTAVAVGTAIATRGAAEPLSPDSVCSGPCDGVLGDVAPP